MLLARWNVVLFIEMASDTFQVVGWFYGALSAFACIPICLFLGNGMRRVMRLSGLSRGILVMTSGGCRLEWRLDKRIRFSFRALTKLMIFSLDESSLLLLLAWTGAIWVWIKFSKLDLNLQDNPHGHHPPPGMQTSYKLFLWSADWTKWLASTKENVAKALW